MPYQHGITQYSRDTTVSIDFISCIYSTIVPTLVKIPNFVHLFVNFIKKIIMTG